MPNNDNATFDALIAELTEVRARLESLEPGRWHELMDRARATAGTEFMYRRELKLAAHIPDDVSTLFALIDALQQQNAFLAMERKKYQEGWGRCMDKLYPETKDDENDEDVPASNAGFGDGV